MPSNIGAAQASPSLSSILQRLMPKPAVQLFAPMDKTLFKGANTEKLNKNLSDRVTDPGFMKHANPFYKRSFQIGVGFAFGFVAYSYLARLANEEIGTKKSAEIKIGTFSINPLSHQSRVVISIAAGLFSAFVTGEIFDRIVL